MNDLTHTAAAVTCGGDKGHEIVSCADEDSADNDPECDRSPAVRGSEDWADDGASTCNGGKMVAEEDGSWGGDVVNIVTEGDSGCRAARIYMGDVLESPTVEVIREKEGYEREQQDRDA